MHFIPAASVTFKYEWIFLFIQLNKIINRTDLLISLKSLNANSR